MLNLIEWILLRLRLKMITLDHKLTWILMCLQSQCCMNCNYHLAPDNKGLICYPDLRLRVVSYKWTLPGVNSLNIFPWRLLNVTKDRPSMFQFTREVYLPTQVFPNCKITQLSVWCATFSKTIHENKLNENLTLNLNLISFFQYPNDSHKSWCVLLNNSTSIFKRVREIF